jgi:probable phosphoglycerate mutase
LLHSDKTGFSMTVARAFTRLLLIRHGAVIPPSVDCLYGGMDVPLSALGKQQAVAAARETASLPISHVYSSPLSRAVYGAECVLDVHQARAPKLSIEADLAEIDRGDWGGRPRAEIEASWPGGLDRLKTDLDFAPPGGESMRNLQRRVIGTYERIIESTPPGETVALVSHMHVTRAIVAHVLGDVQRAPQIEIPLASRSLVEIDIASGKAVMAYVGREPDLALAGGRDSAGNAWGG